MPSSQTALHLLVSMDPLVLSRSSKAWLALVQSSVKSHWGADAPAPRNSSDWGDVGGDIFYGGFKKQPSTTISSTLVPKQSPKPKRWHPLPDCMESMSIGSATLKATLGGPPSPKRWDIPPWFKTLKPNHTEAFSQDSDMVKEARREYFSKHSYDFDIDGNCNLSGTFKHLATSTGLLGTSIYKTQSPWMGPEELKQANYILLSLPKGLKFLWAVPPSQSPKVMGLISIHDPDALCCFSSVTYCPWCRKEGQNKGTVVNHLWTTHYRLGLVCDKCYSCLYTMSDTLCCHGWHDCCQPRESIPSKSCPST